jgi:hypothetical protein
MAEILTAIDEAQRAGFDLSLIEESLSYSYEQRAVHHQRALDLALEMERAGRQLRERSQSTAPAHRFTTQKLSFLDNPEPGVRLLNLYLGTEIGPVDVLGSIVGVGEFEQVSAGAIEIDLFGRRCRVISLDDLIRAKEALGREKDLLAVKELKAIREKQAKS